MRQTTLLLVEDHKLVREGFRGLIRLDPSFEVLGEAEDGRQAVEMAARLHPDVILMDIAMPLLNGFEATRQILAANPAARILILTGHRDNAYVHKAVAIGAAGFLLKHASANELYQGIREVLAGKRVFAASLTGPPKSSSSQRLRAQAAASRLTSRENEVLQLIAEGKANKEAAKILGICVKTVEKHREHLMSKLDIHDTASITRYAIGAGIVESSVQITVV
jgi:DNA-binding NarL/FixJ family response regulator